MALTQVGRYRIEREVARGGMGAVYRARDPDGRPVALKLLLAGKNATPLQRRRVATEIQTLLRLRHENVVELLDAGEHEGVPWLAMEWVEGETLAARLARERFLDPQAAVELVHRLALTLEHCHAQGVLHRDLKPGNVMLRASDGVPLLTDFGLAKDIGSEDSSLGSTGARSVRGRWLGTPGFWPPEQARGELDLLGPRSDVYGLGAVLYAALAGRAPQDGESLPEMVSALEQPPRPPGELRPDVPGWLDAVCLRALAIDPAQRQASAADLARELEEGPAGRVHLPPVGVASPPVAASSPGVLVAAAILVLAGSITIAVVVLGDGRPTPVLAQAAPPSTPPEPPARPRRPALALAREPVPATDPTRDPSDTRAEVERLMASGEARYRTGDLAGALADFDRVLELDPGNAQAHAVRADVRGRQGDRVGELADYDRAIELNPRHVEAHINRGGLRQKQGDLAGALADLDRAIALDPRIALAYYNRGVARLLQGDPDGARADYDRAIELDPRHAGAYYNRGLMRTQQGDLAGAIADLDRLIALDPQNAQAHMSRGVVRRLQGDLAGAIADLSRGLELDPGNAMIHMNRGVVRRLQGDLVGALADWRRFLELAPDHARAPDFRAEVERIQAQLGKQ